MIVGRGCGTFRLHVNARGFEELLARYPSYAQPLSPLETLGGAGGHSGARLWRYRAERGMLVLRAWPINGPSREHLEQLHRWLGLLKVLDFVPAPIPDRAGRALQEWHGGFWEITPWMSGSAEPSPPAPARLRQAFSGLAALHERLMVERIEGVSPGLVHRRDSINRLVQGDFDVLEQALRRRPESEAKNREAALAWLALARKVGPLLLEPLGRAMRRVLSLQPCLRDVRPDHFLFDGERLSGLVDFGAMGIDCVAADLARLIGEWLDGDPVARAEALASYERALPLDPAESSLINVFESATALLIGERWVRWHYVEDRRFDQPWAIAQGIERGLNRLERLVRELAASGHVV
jgi:homoserine kinase type II